ncbi:MAG TPA: winged helix-turn-helix domain-containing protein [Pyrinomonadaceae bacterium]|nr:winged helix-turn-helix domain-containing protein [Pyrinomonadaceae bacterium]
MSRHGQPVPLGAPEFELLLLLVRNHGRVVDKREIMKAVWPDVDVEENNLTVRMSSLRRALGETKEDHPYIKTVTGRGYCLTAEVRELPSQPEVVTSNQTLRDDEPNPREDKAAARQPGDSLPLNGSRRKWEIRHLTLYAIAVVGLLAIFVLYIVLRPQKTGEQSMKISRITQIGRVQWAGLSPDAQTIAYVERDGEFCSLWLQRIGTSNPLQLLPPAKFFYKDPSFSRDGNTLYYSKCQPSCELHKMPVLGGVETPLGIRADSRLTFSPDGKRMTYVRSTAEGTKVTVRVYVANIDGTGEEALNWEANGITWQGGTPAWSPDGKVIALSILPEARQSSMKVIGLGVADRTESTLISDSWNQIRDVVWSPDGRSLIINGRPDASRPEDRTQIWRVPLTGGEPRRITNDLNNYFSMSASADGLTLMALQWEQTSGLWIAPTEDPSAAVQLTAGSLERQDGKQGLSTAPDGRLVYVSDRGGKRDLWSINPDGTRLKQLTDATHRDYFPAVSPDGRYIVFQSGRENAGRRAYNIWRVDADGRNLMQLTRGKYDSEPAFSPDGKWVVYVATEESGGPRLLKVPIEGGEPIRLTDEFSLHPAYSPDGKVIAYYRMNTHQRDQRHFVFIPAEGGAPIKTIPAPTNFGSIMRWAPSGDSLSYRDNTLSALWELPLDGTPPSPIIKLRNQQLFMFSYSQDGRRLVYSGGPDLRDLVLITHFQ